MKEQTPTGTRENGPYDMWDKCLRESEKIELEYDSLGQHLTPNGQVSRLPELYAKIVRTPSFLKWFGDWTQPGGMMEKRISVVYEDSHEPKIVFHGTKADIPPEQGLIPKTSWKYGNEERIYFTDDFDHAKRIAGNSGVVFCAFVKIPIRWDDYRVVRNSSDVMLIPAPGEKR